MKAVDFENKVWEIEKVRIALRCPEYQEVGDYDYKNAIDQLASVTDWLKGRVLPKLNGIT